MNCKKITLSECIEIIGGGTPKTSKKEYWGGEIPWLSVVDFNNDNRYVSKTEKTITQEGLNNCSSRLLGENDIILSARGTVGALAQLSKPMAFNQSCYGIRANELAINDYIYYLLKHSVSILKKNSYGSVFDTITRETFSRIEVLLPDLKTQKRISAVLGSLDNKIELNEKINQNLDWEDYFSICHKIIELEEENQNLEAQAQAIFKSWFVDFEPFKNGKFIDSELGKIPEGWTVNTLSNIVYLKKGKKPKELSEIKHENYIPYLTIDALSGGRPLFCDTEKMLLAKEKDILLVMDGASSGAIFYGLDGVVASTIIKLELTNTEIREIVFAFLNYKQLDLKSHTTGSAIPHLDKDRLLSYKIALPSNGKLLRKISGTLKSLRDNIIRNRKESRRLAQLRDTLLPKLMSGEIDVSDVAV